MVSGLLFKGVAAKRMACDSTRVEGQSLVEYLLVLGITSLVLAFLGPVLRTAVGFMETRFLTGLLSA